jgi:hypothetical protein
MNHVVALASQVNANLNEILRRCSANVLKLHIEVLVDSNSLKHSIKTNT